jgi:hypothetical protein
MLKSNGFVHQGLALLLDKPDSVAFKCPDHARVAELVDARDLKSLGIDCRAGSIPASGTK